MGGNINDDRGEQLSEFFLVNNLFIINEKDSEPTFETVNGKSWIDLSVTSGEMLPKVTHWEIKDEVTMSDHKYISFGFFASTMFC